MKADRLTRRFLLRDPDTLTDAELLELLLRFSTDDAQVLTERILAQYPNIAAVIEADTDALRVDRKSVV